MANWLSRATGGFRKPPPPAPEPYNVRCDCGGNVNGVRAAGPQRPSCPACGRQVFILPMNIYPVTVRPKKPAAKTPAPPEAEARAATGTPEKPGRQNASVAEAEAAPARPAGILLESRTRVLTPFRVIVFAMTVIAVLTGWGLWRRHQVESAKANVLAANEAGMKALNEGDFVIAARELTRARNAVDILHRTDAEANAIRRHCREAVAGYGLDSSGLFDLLSEFAADPRRGKSRFGSLHRDSWLLLDATVIVPESTHRPCVLDMPLVFNERKFRIEIDSAVVRSAASRPESGSRVIFAAQMSDISISGKDSSAVLVLNGKTAFLWTSLETYKQLGYVEDRADDVQATNDLLVRQLEQMEAAK